MIGSMDFYRENKYPVTVTVTVRVCYVANNGLRELPTELARTSATVTVTVTEYLF